MKISEAKALEMRRGNQPCNYPFLEMERDEIGTSTGDYVCTRCGKAGWDGDWNKLRENKKNPEQRQRNS